MKTLLRDCLLATAFLLGSPAMPAHAAESYDNCTGFIDTLPATLSTQGVWCLRQNLSTAMTSGTAINIAANNITIDCNDFKIGGLAAGDASLATGVYAQQRQNATIRNCGIRGFHRGIWLEGGAGHLVEDNRLDNNLFAGMVIGGENNRVQRNRVYDSGGLAGGSIAYGIYALADANDNTVSGVFAQADNAWAYGLYVLGVGNEVSGNRVRGLLPAGTGTAHAIIAGSANIAVAGNRVSGTPGTAGQGIAGNGANTFCSGNTVEGYAIAYSSCDHAFGNLPVAP